MNNITKKILPTFDVFQREILDVININENTPEYINDDNFSFKQENIYNQFIRLYGEESHNFNNDKDYLDALSYSYSENMLTFYIKSKAFQSENLEKISTDFYKAINENKNTVDENATSNAEGKASTTPSNATFNDMIDALQVNGVTRDIATNILKHNSVAMSSTTNKFRLFKANEQAEFKTQIKTFLNAFAPFYTSISSQDSTKDLKYQTFANGYVVMDVDYLGLDNKRDIAELEDFTLDLQTQVSNLGNQKTVYDPIEGVQKFINQFDISYWKGLTKEEIYTAISASGTSFNMFYIYRQGFIVQYINGTNLLGWAISKIDDNKGNDPETSPDAWELLTNAPINVNEIIEQLKPYIDDVINNLEQVDAGTGLIVDDVLDIIRLDDETIETLAQVPLKVDTNTFKDSQDAQDKTFKNSQDAQDKTFKDSQDAQDKTFKDSQDAQDKAFNESQDTQDREIAKKQDKLEYEFIETKPYSATSNGIVPTPYNVGDIISFSWARGYFGNADFIMLNSTTTLDPRMLAVLNIDSSTPIFRPAPPSEEFTFTVRKPIRKKESK